MVKILKNEKIKIKYTIDKNYKKFIKTDYIKLIHILQTTPFKYYMLRAYPSINTDTFKFYLIDKTEKLSKMKPDTKTYKKYFDSNKNIKNIKNKKENYSTFLNLSGETILTVPKIIPKILKKNKKAYLNISTFSKNVPIKYQIELWKEVFKQLEKCFKISKKCYLNTHGLGIGWLHIRIDKTPKYYKD